MTAMQIALNHKFKKERFQKSLVNWAWLPDVKDERKTTLSVLMHNLSTRM